MVRVTEKQNKISSTLRSLLPLFLISIVLSALMVGVFVLIGRYDRTVLFGALLGTAASIIHFIAMTLSLLWAEKAESSAKAVLKVRGIFILRMAVLVVVLVIALKTKLFNPFATLLPLCFFRIAMFLNELVFHKSKKGGA